MDFKALWLIWIVAFLILETVAIITPGDNTFSHHVWEWVNIDEGWTIDRILLLVFCIWLLIHMVWQKFG